MKGTDCFSKGLFVLLECSSITNTTYFNSNSELAPNMKRLRVGEQFWDHDWKCMNSNAQWSDDECATIAHSVNPAAAASSRLGDMEVE